MLSITSVGIALKKSSTATFSQFGINCVEKLYVYNLSCHWLRVQWFAPCVQEGCESSMVGTQSIQVHVPPLTCTDVVK